MSLHTIYDEKYEVYFCTITCYKWLPLFEESDCYYSVYRSFDHLKKEGCLVTGYVPIVIGMPNHLHVLLFPTHSGRSLNKLVGEGKRFMAYDIVKSLRKQGKTNILVDLESGVQKKEKLKGKLHQVFRLSFDARICFDEKMVEQKLDYIHHNPVKGKWSLVEDYTLYPHSSASFYELDREGKFEVVHYKDLSSRHDFLREMLFNEGET